MYLAYEILVMIKITKIMIFHETKIDKCEGNRLPIREMRNWITDCCTLWFL